MTRYICSHALKHGCDQNKKHSSVSNAMLKLMQIILFFMLSVVSVSAGNINGVGLKKLNVNDPIDNNSMEAVVFFPSTKHSTVTPIGPYQIAASKSLPIVNDTYPLILISHGNMGSMWGHHDFATSLAQQGYIVATVTHPGDNFQNSSRIGAISSLYGRPMQISAVLTATLKDPVVGNHIDKDRIGFIGFSAGGTTGLILAGGKPTLTRLLDYCANRPNDFHVCESKGDIRIDIPELAPSADPRIRAFVLLAPLSVIFAPKELNLIKSPLLIFVGDEDKELSPESNAVALAKTTHSVLQVISNAGHFIFLSPCSPNMRRTMPNLCVDPKGSDRVMTHKRVLSDIIVFFKKTLDVN